MKVRFVVLEPESKKGSYNVPLPIILGRGNEAKFRIQQDRISRKHCEVFEQDGDVYVRDLGSTNGTFLDGMQVSGDEAAPVPPGSVIRLGSIVIRLEYEGTGRLVAATFVEETAAEEAAVVPEGTAAAPEAEPADEPSIDEAATSFMETAKAPDSEDLAALDVAEPAVDSFAGFEGEPAPPVEGGSFDFLGGAAAETSEDDKLGDFFKGLQ